MASLPTYISLFVDDATALSHFKSLFPAITSTDADIIEAIRISFLKIMPVFGQIRNYYVDEVTIRNEYIKNAVSFEAQSILVRNNGVTPFTYGGLNTGTDAKEIVAESMGNISKQYAGQSVGAKIKASLGLLSNDAGVILSKFTQKTFAWSGNGVVG